MAPNKKGILSYVDAESEQPSSGDRTRPESQILSVAKRFLCGQLGVIAASRELSLLRHEVETELAVVVIRSKRASQVRNLR